MSISSNIERRRLLGGLAGLAVAATLPVWGQSTKPNFSPRGPTLLQIVDTSPGQIDVSRDFLTGSRAAWQDINARGGLRGNVINHQSLEVDGSTLSIRNAVDAIKAQANVFALMGTAGDVAAAQLVDVLRRELPDIAHIAPWLQNSRLDFNDSTFSIFASRQEQIAHAVKSLAGMGVNEIGAVYASPAEFATYQGDVERSAAGLALRLKTYGPVANLQQLAASLTVDSPRILIFLGGTPELFQFSQGVNKQASQRYIVAMADVNLQVLQQLGLSRHASVIATQVVPMVNSGAPVVRSYRETLARLYDEPPTPLSLSGYVAARYAYEVLLGVEGAPTRASALQAFQRRSSLDLGGFRIDLDARRKGNAYVTQSMIAPDGRIIG